MSANDPKRTSLRAVASYNGLVHSDDCSFRTAGGFNDSSWQSSVAQWRNIQNGRSCGGMAAWLGGGADLRPITERMLALAGIGPGHRVLDVAAGNGEQTLMAARLVGPRGSVLATDIADRLLAYLDEAARRESLTNVQTRSMDARRLELEPETFDAAICRLRSEEHRVG